MARLTIQNVDAPDLSGTSSILNNASNAFNAGINSASGLLDSYIKGQQETADSAILGTIAGISSEDELAKFINSGELEKVNLSPKMRETILNLRSNILANNQSRANINNTNASTSIRQAAEGRAAAEYADSVATRNALRALTPSIVEANLEGNTQGTGVIVNPDGTISEQTLPKPAFDSFADAIAKSVNLDPAQATALLAQAYEAQSFGQNRIDTRRKLRQDETSANAILTAIKDPANIKGSDITKSLIDNPDLGSSNNIISTIERANALQEGPLGQVLTPTPNVPIPEVVRNSVELFKEREAAALDASVQNRLATKAKEFRTDPTKSLIEDLKLSSDSQNPESYFFGFFGEDYDELNITRQINQIAKEENVTPAIVATAMSEVFERDPSGLNITENRFDPTKVKNYIRNNLSQEALARYEENRVVTESKDREVNSLVLQLSEARSRALKYSGEVPETLTKQIEELQTKILKATNTPVLKSGQQDKSKVESDNRRTQLLNYLDRTGFNAQLASTTPGSPERQRTIRTITSVIQRDPSLTPSQKASLILSISE